MSRQGGSTTIVVATPQVQSIRSWTAQATEPYCATLRIRRTETLRTLLGMLLVQLEPSVWYCNFNAVLRLENLHHVILLCICVTCDDSHV
mmetsp:Transcript_10516/g.25461  ORF Transcript_10516/g.25461 Transcript_10516/m.25461 type:complete len:90 (-) Transcript_10516:278-547(-)